MAEDYAAFSVSSARIAIVMGQLLNCRRQAIMADPPFAAACVAEQALGGKIEQAPAPPPARGIRAIDRVQHRIDFGAMGIEQRQPVARGARIMIARPAPLRLNPEQIGELCDQAVAGHDPAGKEMLRDPVGAVGGVKPVGMRPMREHMHKQPALGGQPIAHACQQCLPVGHTR